MQVFISHAREPDGRFADRLASDLSRLGVGVWIAPKSICSGESWVAAIQRGLTTSSHAVLVVTPAAVTSKWVRKELELAIPLQVDGKLEIVPLDLAPTDGTDIFIKALQAVPFRGDYGHGLAMLGARLGLDRERVEDVSSGSAPAMPDWLLDARPAEVATDLRRLAERLDDVVPPKSVGQNLLLAAWNLRGFAGVTEKWHPGPKDSPKRGIRDLLSIAAILSRFDVVILSEVHQLDTALRQVVAALNQNSNRWGYIQSEMYEQPGNPEQHVVVYDSRRVIPKGFQSQINERTAGLPVDIFSTNLVAAPLVMSFDARGYTVKLVRLQFRYGGELSESVDQILDWWKRWSEEECAAGGCLIAIGDFNADRVLDPMFHRVAAIGLRAPEELQSPIAGTRLFYDQFAWLANADEPPRKPLRYSGDGGSVEWGDILYPDLPSVAKSWRISDHLPLWVEFRRPSEMR